MGSVVALIKPQFEAGPERIGKNGIIKDPQVHLEVVNEVLTFTSQMGYQIVDLTYSPITGGEGNIEYLVHLRNSQTPNTDYDQTLVERIVKESHESLA